MAEVSPQLDPVYQDCMDLEKKLLCVAYRKFASVGCVGIDGILPGTGKSARGLVQDTIVKLLRVGKWRPGENGQEIYGYALAALNTLFIDVLREADHKNIDVVDPIELDTLKASNEVSVEIRLLRAERFELLMVIMGKDTDGKAYLSAVREGARTRKEIAAAMDKTPEDVTKIQRRVKYKLRTMEDILEE